MSKKKDLNNIQVVNKKATYSYHILQKFEAGMQLYGTEVKSIRSGLASMRDAYCIMEKGELHVRNLHISEYKLGTDNNHIPLRSRKLLLKKQELKKIDKKIREKGFTVIPMRIYVSDRGYIKMEIAIAQGKNTYDKSQSIKEKDMKRETDRAKNRYS